MNIQYNLACYACVSGDLDVAKEKLKRAFELDPELKLTSLDDPDLDLLLGPAKNRGVAP